MTNDTCPIITARLHSSEYCCIIKSNQKYSQISHSLARVTQPSAAGAVSPLCLQRGKGEKLKWFAATFMYSSFCAVEAPGVSGAPLESPSFGGNCIWIMLIALV